MSVSKNIFFKKTGSFSSLIYVLFVNSVLILGAITCLLPVIHLVAVSFSNSAAATSNSVGIIPIGFNFNSYKEVFSDPKMLNAILVSVQRILIGIPINMILTLLAAYPLSFNKDEFPLRNVYSGILIFTMLFGGGLIPSYILINELGLMNNIFALILPGIPIFNVIIMMNFFRQLPSELKEAAYLDGANHMQVLIKIYVPISGAVFATLVLFCFVGHWNSWFDGLIFMSDMKNYPLQTYLQSMLSKITASPNFEDAIRMASLSKRSLLFARIAVSILPFLILYPSLQKYYKTGLVMGSVKG